MRQNRGKAWARVVSSILFIVLSCLFMSSSFPSADGAKMSIDASLFYKPAIETGVVTNWHSALFLLECRGLKLLADSISETPLDGFVVQYIVWWFFYLLMLGSMVCINCFLQQKDPLWVWGSLVFSPLCSFFATALGNNGYYGLDFYFASLLLTGIALMLLYRNFEHRYARFIVALILLVVVFHMASYRRNFIVVAPFFVWWMLSAVFNIQRLSVRWRMMLCFLGVIMVYVIPNKLLETVLDVRVEYPMAPMMESNIRIAAILRGEQNEWVHSGYIEENRPDVDDVICASWVSKRKDVSWDSFVDEYKRHWVNYPASMLSSCIIQRIQFYCGGQNYSWLRSIVQNMYPSVKKNEKAWKIRAPRPSPHPRVQLLLLAFPLMVLLLLRYGGKKGYVNQDELNLIRITCICAILYASSYLIVTPSVHTRYLAPSCMLSLYVFLIVCVCVVARFKKKCRLIKDDTLVK